VRARETAVEVPNRARGGFYWVRFTTSEIVHVFATPVIEKSAVRFLNESTRMLLDESRVPKKKA
jgi:hypothetical protein